MAKIETKYFIAFAEYKSTNEYKSLVDTFKNKGFNQPYINNIIEQIFTAGYNSK
jgi:hypothetical protein